MRHARRRAEPSIEEIHRRIDRDLSIAMVVGGVALGLAVVFLALAVFQ